MTMKAILLNGKPGSRTAIKDFLSIETIPIPEIKTDQVLVRVKATALNIEDIMIGVGWRFGTAITATKEKPVVLGQEFSGVVEKVGTKVKKFKPGDTVLGHKLPMRVRFGSWAEFVVIDEKSLVLKPSSYSHAEAAAIPMQCQVAQGAVEAAGFLKRKVLDNCEHKRLNPEDVEVVVDEKNKALITKAGTDIDKVTQAKVAVVGASSTSGLMMTDMLVSRGVDVVGVCSASSAPAVLSNGAIAVLDRNAGGLEAKPSGLNLEVVFDCVGGQKIEDTAREVLGNKGHFVTIAGPGEGFGAEIDSVSGLMSHMTTAACRSFKSKFSGTKYTLAAMPVTGGAGHIQQHLQDNLKSVVDSEVDMFDWEALKAAIEKVNNHKTRGRLVLVIK